MADIDVEKLILGTQRGRRLLETLTRANPNMTKQQVLRYAHRFIGKLFEESEDSTPLRRLPDRPGRDEPENSNLDKLALYTSKLEFEGQTQPKRKQSVQDFRRQLKWLYDLIDEAQRTKRFRTTGNSFQSGRFYTFNYVPRHEKQLPIWDARPVILCLDAKYATHYYGNYSKKPNIGVLAINWHYVPLRQRRRMLKQLIYDDRNNRENFKNNKAIETQAIESLSGVYNGVQKNGALRQYLRGGRYKNKNGEVVTAGAFNITQIPYSNITEILEIPSVYDSAWVGGKPPGL